MKPIANAKEVIDLVSGKFINDGQEHLFSINLNSIGVPTSVNLISIGSDTCVEIPVKFIVKKAILDNACNVIIIHDHPSGNPTPSKADVERTEQLRDALHMFDMQLMDHVIMAGDKYFSFADETASVIL